MTDIGRLQAKLGRTWVQPILPKWLTSQSN
jgi:hypothetical protein